VKKFVNQCLIINFFLVKFDVHIFNAIESRAYIYFNMINFLCINYYKI